MLQKHAHSSYGSYHDLVWRYDNLFTDADDTAPGLHATESRKGAPVQVAELEKTSPKAAPEVWERLSGWLQAGPAISVAVFSFQAALVSSRSAFAQGVSLSVDRISLHLGPVKSASRPGTVTAALLALRDVPVPRQGFRASLGGIQLAVATTWAPQESRQEARLAEGLKVMALTVIN